MSAAEVTPALIEQQMPSCAALGEQLLDGIDSEAIDSFSLIEAAIVIADAGGPEMSDNQLGKLSVTERKMLMLHAKLLCGQTVTVPLFGVPVAVVPDETKAHNYPGLW